MMRFFRPIKIVNRQWIAALGMLGLFVLGIFLFSHTVFAAEPTALEAVGAASGLPQVSIGILIARIIRVILGVLGFLTVILVIYGGFLYFMSSGDVDKIKKAKKVLTSTLIGLVIIFTSYSVASWILNKLLEAAFGPGTITSSVVKFSEPFGGSLGAGIIESHYPMRGAFDVPRNTKVFVTFKEAIDPTTIIADYKDGATPQSTKLNDKGVKIFKTAEGPSKALTTDQVQVGMTANKKTFVFSFKSIGYLGSPDVTTGYTVFLTPVIQRANNKGPAFEGENSKGYEWDFIVSKTIDSTPPKIESVISNPGSKADRNITVELTFNEPMDPLASTGTFILGDESFTNISATFVPLTNLAAVPAKIYGTYEISNGYKTVGFTTTDECAKDPCGNKIYCLPGLSSIKIDAKAASLTDDLTDQPQAKLGGDGASYDGLVDAAGNSFDGNGAANGKGDGKACGSKTDKIECIDKAENDDYIWSYSTTANIDKSIPKIISLDPDTKPGGIDVQAPLTITFEKLLLGSSINSLNIMLSSDPVHKALWFVSGKTDIPNDKPLDVPIQSKVLISHATFLSAKELIGQDYWPILTQGVKGINQFCMFPAASLTCSSTTSSPFCCNGIVQSKASDCKNDSKLPVHP